jgi:hypothetical protein
MVNLIARDFLINSLSRQFSFLLKSSNLKGFYLNISPGGDLFATLQSRKTFNGGLNDIVRIMRPHTLCQNILNACSFQYGSNGSACDKAGTFGSGF